MMWNRIWMRGLLVSVVVGMIIAQACGTPEPETSPLDFAKELASKKQAIINGKKDLAYPAAGSLQGTTQGQRASFCSGTLIGARLVLTAAHCVDAFSRVQKVEFRFDVFTGTNTYRAVYKEVDVQASKRHPQYSGQNQSPIANDIAVLVLKTPVTEIVPMPYNTTKIDASWIGRDLFFMGYGRLTRSSQTPAKDKYSTSLTIKVVDKDANTNAAKINTVGYEGKNSSVCQGDSGGPAMFKINGKMHVVGVTSHGSAINCTGVSYSYRSDPYAAWIQGFFDKYEVCQSDKDCSACATCSGKKCTPKALAANQNNCKPCAKNSDCGAGGACVSIGTGLRCVQTASASGCCPSAYFVGESNGQKVCLPDAMECPALSCTKASDCSSKEVCVNGKCAQKLPPPRKELCQPCAKNSECGKDGFCQSVDGRGGRCLQPCDADDLCPPDFACKEIAAGIKQCLPKDNVCRAACNADSQCKGGLKCDNGTCKRPGGGDAGEPCASDLPCKTGLSCIKNTEGEARCFRTCGVSAGAAGAPCKAGGVCDKGLSCFRNPLGGGSFCVQSCAGGATCTDGGNCFPQVNVCVCQNDSQCKNGTSCNTVLAGFGACGGGKQQSCAANEECVKSAGQGGVCLAKNSGTRGLGQSCGRLERCRSGLTCLDFLNVCVEDCSGGKKCTQGGNCINAIPGFAVCGCRGPQDCPKGLGCQVVAQGIGVCRPPSGGGCSNDSQCPRGFICESKKCVQGTRPEPKPEPKVEPADEKPKAEPPASEPVKDAGAGTPDSGPNTKESTASETPKSKDTAAPVVDNNQGGSCGCQAGSSEPSTGLSLLGFLLLLLPLLRRRRRFIRRR